MFFSLPILLIVAILIKIDSHGPIVFKQIRTGKKEKEFYIFKFRTMYIDAPTEARSPTDGLDPRITRIGRMLRKTSLDELPQLINILKGEMSFIGPRPEMKWIVDKVYTDFEKQRLLVKPGITGLWQISPVRVAPIHENLQYDFYYINNVSLLLDVKIAIKTVLVMVKSNTH